MKLLAIFLIFTVATVFGKVIMLDTDSNKELNGAADNLVVKDETVLTLEDKKPVLSHLNEDIEEMEEVKKKIDFLEHQLRNHADKHIVDGTEIAIANDKLKIYQEALKNYEDNLVALKNLVTKAKHRFGDESLEEMISVVERAEFFLKKAELSVDHAEIVEQRWEAEEESKLIEDMFAKDESNLNSIKGKQVKPIANLSKDLQNRLFLNNWPGYPVGKEGRLVILSDNSKEVMKRKYSRINKVKKLTEQKASKVNLTEGSKQKIDEEVLADIIKGSVHEDPVEHYSPEVKKALEVEDVEAIRNFVQEKLVQQPQEAGVLPRLLPGLAALFMICVAIGVLIFRRATNGHRRSPNKDTSVVCGGISILGSWMPHKMRGGTDSPPGGRQVPDVHVDDGSSASAWNQFSSVTNFRTPSKSKQK